LDLKQLRYFLQVAEQGSFSRAARLLDLSQPALSRQIRLLEVEVRHNLLVRNGRGVTLTDAGDALRKSALRILHEVDLAHAELGKLRNSNAGHVNIGLPTGLAKVFAAPFVNEFRERLPGASLSITDGLSASLQQLLISGQLDIALLYRPRPSADLDTFKVMDEELFLVGHALGNAPSITLRQVAKLPLVIPRRPHEIRMLVETAMAEVGCKPTVALEVDGVPAILDVLASGAGYAILPVYAVAIYSKSETYSLQKIIEPSVFSMLAVATSSRRLATPTQVTVLRVIEDMCRSLLVPAINLRVREFLDTRGMPLDEHSFATFTARQVRD
jgi:LysR family nitrogen assimilation transcriptional regulator